MSEKVDQATGVITIAFGWLSVALTPQDALTWWDTMVQLAPFFLIVFLIWRMRGLDNQLKSCREGHERVNQQLLLAYTAVREVSIREHMPTPEAFLDGDFNIKECLDDNCDLRRGK